MMYSDDELYGDDITSGCYREATPPLRLGRQRCRECGHVANVSADCQTWACQICQRVQQVMS